MKGGIGGKDGGKSQKDILVEALEKHRKVDEVEDEPVNPHTDFQQDWDEDEPVKKTPTPLTQETPLAKPIQPPPQELSQTLQDSVKALLKDLKITASFTKDRINIVYPKEMSLLETIRINKILEENGLKGKVNIEKITAFMNNEDAKTAFKTEVQNSSTPTPKSMTQLGSEFVKTMAEKELDIPDQKPTILRDEAKKLDSEPSMEKPVPPPQNTSGSKISPIQGIQYFLQEDSPFFGLVKLGAETFTANRTMGTENIETMEIFTEKSPINENEEVSQEIEALQQALDQLDILSLAAVNSGKAARFKALTSGTDQGSKAFVLLVDRKEIAEKFDELKKVYHERLADIKERDKKLAEEKKDNDLEDDLEDDVEIQEEILSDAELPPPVPQTTTPITQELMEEAKKVPPPQYTPPPFIPQTSIPILTSTSPTAQQTVAPTSPIDDATMKQILSEFKSIQKKDGSPVSDEDIEKLKKAITELKDEQLSNLQVFINNIQPLMQTITDGPVVNTDNLSKIYQDFKNKDKPTLSEPPKTTTQTTPIVTVQPSSEEAELRKEIVKDKEFLETDDKKNSEETKKREENIKKLRSKLNANNPEAPGKHLRGLEQGREKAKEMVKGMFDDAAKIQNPYEQLAAYIVAILAALFAGVGILGNKGLEKVFEVQFKQIQPHLNNLEKLYKQKTALEDKIAKLKDDEPLTPRQQANLNELEAKLKRCNKGIEAHESLIKRMATNKENKAEDKIQAAQTKIDDAEALKKASEEMIAYCDTTQAELQAQLDEEKDVEKQKPIKAQLEEVAKTRKEAEDTIKAQDKIIESATQELDSAKKEKDKAQDASAILGALGTVGQGVGLDQTPPPQTQGGSTSILTVTKPTTSLDELPPPLDPPTSEQLEEIRRREAETRGAQLPEPIIDPQVTTPLFTQKNNVGALSQRIGEKVKDAQEVIDAQMDAQAVLDQSDPTLQAKKTKRVRFEDEEEGKKDKTKVKKEGEAEEELVDLDQDQDEEVDVGLELEGLEGEKLDEALEKQNREMGLLRDDNVSAMVFGGAAKARTEAVKEATLKEMESRIKETWPMEKVEQEQEELDENDQPIIKEVDQPVELRAQLEGEAYDAYIEQHENKSPLDSALEAVKDSKDTKEMQNQLQFLLRGARQQVMDLKKPPLPDKEPDKSQREQDIEVATRTMMAIEKMQHMLSTMKAMNKGGQKMSEEQYKVHWAKIHTILSKHPPIVEPGYIGQLNSALNKIDKDNVYRPPVTKLGKAGETLAKPGKAIARKVREKPVKVEADASGNNVQLHLNYSRARVTGTVGVFEQHKHRKTQSGAKEQLARQVSEGLTIAMNQYGKGSEQNPISITYIPPERPQPEAALAMLLELKERAMLSGQNIHLLHPVTKEPMRITPQSKLTPEEASCFNHFANQRPIVGAKMGQECAGYAEFKNVRDNDGNKLVDKEQKKGGKDENEVDFTDAINARLDTRMKVLDKKIGEKIDKIAGIDDPDRTRTSRLGT